MKENKRYIILTIIITIVGIVFIYKLMQLQIVHGTEYENESIRKVFKTETVKSERGEIYDRYGRPLINNRPGFSIQIYDNKKDQDSLNIVLKKLLKLFDKYDVKVADNLPISLELPYKYIFQGENQGEVIASEMKWKEKREIDSNISAESAIELLRKRYEIDKSFSQSDIRRIIGIREEMKRKGFNENNPFTIAADVNIELVMCLEEGHLEYPGVKIVIEPLRDYTAGSLAAHILGRVGIIFAEEYEKLKISGYGMNDILGKYGIEKVMETELKGTDGKKSVEENLDGNILKVLANVPAVPGNNVILSLDADLQKVAEESLERTTKEIRKNAEERIKANQNLKYIGEDAAGGAVVAMDVNTGEILAMATYPSYNPDTFNQDYNKLLNDPLKPMLNRAVAGTYSPGSTFKMLTAIAALEEGVITIDDTVTCKGEYEFYEYAGYTPHCWIYASKYGYATHGKENVSHALRDSCNYFFYDVGRRLTIENIEKYGKEFGLGQKTGIEIAGENKGILGGPESREITGGGKWYPGETLGAAIGEMHAFTPIQLVSYVNTIASKGIRYKAHLIKEVKDYEGNTIYEVEPEVLSNLNLNQHNLEAVLEGMREVTGENGTASRIFKDFPISVAGKTGTAEMRNSSSNGIFVGFAPYNNPQISVAVVIEHGGSGGNTAPVAKDIIASYLKVYGYGDENFPSQQIIP